VCGARCTLTPHLLQTHSSSPAHSLLISLRIIDISHHTTPHTHVTLTIHSPYTHHTLTITSSFVRFGTFQLATQNAAAVEQVWNASPHISCQISSDLLHSTPRLVQVDAFYAQLVTKLRLQSGFVGAHRMLGIDDASGTYAFVTYWTR
jgi:hypothetical protein